jgi:hypothetical protein
MVRILNFIVMVMALGGTAVADGPIRRDGGDICAALDDEKRVARCRINDYYARLWVQYKATDMRVLYQCIRLVRWGGFLHLRACVLSRCGTGACNHS